ncbi:MAG TPA: hypothetical protein VMP10_05500, partial [Chloroflexota bacterium]|nr:hypothetical protein [Chloroflexota bacterium]
SSIGVLASDLVWVGRGIDGLAFTLDLSHAHLSANAQTRVVDQADRSLDSLVDSLSEQAEVANLLDFVEQVSSDVVTVHVSDAKGLLGEGLAYGSGDAPLDVALRHLLPRVKFLVTEVVEPDPNRCPNMRVVEERLRILRAEMLPTTAEIGAGQ